MGSFAESLTLESEIPLFIVNPRTAPTKHYEEVVFPTDLSEESFRGFQEVMRVTRQIGAKITLYHKVQFFGEMVEGFNGLGQEIENREAKLLTWSERAKSSGVGCEIFIDKKPGGLVESILEYAAGARSELIAMVAESGELETKLLGSVTRQVIRHADCPVLVFRADTKNLEMR